MASAAVQNKTPRKVLKKSTRDSLIAYSFIAPNFIGFCVFTLVRMGRPPRHRVYRSEELCKTLYHR